MALIQSAPEDLASSNALDYIEDPDAPQAPRGERAEIYLSGAHVCTLENPPTGAGARVTLMVEIEVVEEGYKFKEHGEIEVPVRRCKRVGEMWLPGTQRPPTSEEIATEQAREKARLAREKADRDEAERAEKEFNEPPMFDEEGNPLSIDAPRPPTDDDDGDNVVQFSDSSKA